MPQPTLQMLMLTLAGFSLGLLLGWVIVSLRKGRIEKRLQYELTGVHANFQSAREDAHQLRGQLKLLGEQKSRLLKMLESTSGHKDFLEVRRKLELSRRQIQLLKAELNRREQIIFDLKDVIHTLRRHLYIRPQPEQKEVAKLIKLPVVENSEDNLQLINGLSAEIAYQLRSMGIVNYRQLAECSPQQLSGIQRLIGQNEILPLQQWATEASQLYHQKYGQGPVKLSRSA